MFKILVTGGREFGNPLKRIEKPPYYIKRTGREYEIAMEQREFIYTTLDEETWKYSSDGDLKIIAGDAWGVDHNAIQWAMINSIAYKEYKANWKKHKKAAGPVRNQQMLDEEVPFQLVNNVKRFDVSEIICFAFPGGKGTADMKNRCRAIDIEVVEFKFNG